MPRATKSSVFLDSSVFISGLLSQTGGSFRVLAEAHRGTVRITSILYVVDEVNSVLKRKYPGLYPRFAELLRFGRVHVESDPPLSMVAAYGALITDIADAPILAGVDVTHSQFLLTLDQRDFFTRRLAEAHLPFIIATPQSFFTLFDKRT